jgi:hypothetical protein
VSARAVLHPQTRAAEVGTTAARTRLAIPGGAAQGTETTASHLEYAPAPGEGTDAFAPFELTIVMDTEQYVHGLRVLTCGTAPKARA